MLQQVGGRQTSARTQMYIKRTKWIISYKEVCGCRPPPSIPDYILAVSSNHLRQKLSRPHLLNLFSLASLATNILSPLDTDLWTALPSQDSAHQ